MKIFGTIAGISFIGALIFMFWWLRWNDESQVHVQELEKQIQVLERFWNMQSAIQGGKFTLGYQEAVPVGFPFGMKVRLIKPYLKDVNGSREFSIQAPYVDFVPIENTSRSFGVEYPNDADAVYRNGGNTQKFYLHLSKAPDLVLRKHTLRSAAVNEFGLTFPKTMVFSVVSGSKTFKLPMAFKAAGSPVWRPMYSDMRVKMKQLSDFLRRSMLGL